MRNQQKIEECKQVVWDYYQSYKRQLPWRPPQLTIQKNGDLDDYSIFISEVMLQQTQVSRVRIKYPSFIKSFPSFDMLSKAPLRDVLSEWHGMGYNRRAKFLKQTAEVVVEKYKGKLPKDISHLEELPGIGPATACSIATFVHNTFELFIETNIRRVMIYHFFPNKNDVTDGQIIPFIEKVVDHNNPREWYYALMDYGAWLSKVVPNPNRRSKHYSKQSRFEGSNRQIRGEILKTLLTNGTIQKESVSKLFSYEKSRLQSIFDELVSEKMIFQNNKSYFLK